MKISFQIITHNNEKTILQCLKSLGDNQILVADLGSTDKTIQIVKDFTNEIYRYHLDDKNNEIRNKLILNSNYEWKMYIEPFEILDNLTIQDDCDAYYGMIFNGGIISKETRLWRKGHFIYPVFEKLNIESKFCNYNLHSSYVNSPRVDKILNEWQKNNPTNYEPYYYQAFSYLAKKDYKNFSKCYDEVLFRGQNSLMIDYYHAVVMFYFMNDGYKALKSLMSCIEKNPLMAEFWCLLGDMYCSKYPSKAKCFYENAILLGEQRDLTDENPIEINKYKKYPQFMLNKLNNS